MLYSTLVVETGLIRINNGKLLNPYLKYVKNNDKHPLKLDWNNYHCFLSFLVYDLI